MVAAVNVETKLRSADAACLGVGSDQRADYYEICSEEGKKEGREKEGTYLFDNTTMYNIYL